MLRAGFFGIATAKWDGPPVMPATQHPFFQDDYLVRSPTGPTNGALQ